MDSIVIWKEEREMQGEIQREKGLGYVGKLLLPVKVSRHFKFCGLDNCFQL